MPWFLHLLGFIGLLFFLFLTYEIHLILTENQEGGDISKKLVFSSTIKNLGNLERKGLDVLGKINISVLQKMELESFLNIKNGISKPLNHYIDSSTIDKEKLTPHHLSCPHGDLVEFWKGPRIDDLKWKSPFADVGFKKKYVTFEPDPGGWNNIRMQFETILVFALATGRIFVLPPDQPMYLLNKGKGSDNHHGFDDYFPFEEIKKRLPVITMEEFMKREAVTGHFTNQSDPTSTTILYPPGNKTVFNGANRNDRNAMWEYLRTIAACPPWKPMKQYLIIPPAPSIKNFYTSEKNKKEVERRREISAAGRDPRMYDEYWQSQKVIHYISKPGLGYRLLQHFYTFIHFDDVKVDRLMKRFIRDYVHYIDLIFCKAALIIQELLQEGSKKRVPRYSAFHIRRGELQYKEVKIPSAKILENVGHHIPAGQLIYIATDEKNKEFFDDFKTRFPTIRFLDDYFPLAKLSEINPNYLGMIDQVICTQGDKFVGTWFSTFTGYITRMRGYVGWHDHTVWLGDKKHMNRYQHDENPKFPYYMREWNTSWVALDE